jgi:E3 ubiquitin-protein ligase HERC2
MKAIREGVDFVIPLNICAIVDSKMVEIRATGDKVLDVGKLKSITDYRNCSDRDDFIKYFWEVLEGFNMEDRSLYLKFVWGRTRLPASTEHKHKIVAIPYNQNSCLPLSHTCFFTLDLPRYPSKEIAREKILFAIQYCGDIDADRSAHNIDPE